MNISEIQEQVNLISQKKVQNGEYVAGRDGVQGTGLGVIVVDGVSLMHKNATKEKRKLSNFNSPDDTISSIELISNTLGRFIETRMYDYDVYYQQNEWDGNEDRIICLESNYFDSTEKIFHLVEKIKLDKVSSDFFNQLYNRGITDIVFKSIDKRFAFTYFFYNTQSQSQNSYDRFKPFQRLTFQPFIFQPSRYEVWQAGSLVREKSVFGQIEGQLFNTMARIDFINLNLENEISNGIYFDVLVTQVDRLLLATIPADEELGEHEGLTSMRSLIGATRQEKKFSNLEPYCCSLFTQNGVITKVSFSLNNPAKLIEFYK